MRKRKGKKNKRLVDCPCNCAVWGPWRFCEVERGDKQIQAKSEIEIDRHYPVDVGCEEGEMRQGVRIQSRNLQHGEAVTRTVFGSMIVFLEGLGLVGVLVTPDGTHTAYTRTVACLEAKTRERKKGGVGVGRQEMRAIQGGGGEERGEERKRRE